MATTQTPLNRPRLFHTGVLVRCKEAWNDNLWLVVGGTDPWPNADDIPPDGYREAKAIEQPLFALPADCYYIFPDEKGPIRHRAHDNPEQRWRVLADSQEAYELVCQWLLITCTLRGSHFSTFPTLFRQLGFFSGLVPATGHAEDIPLLAEHIDEYGFLESVYFRSPQRADTELALFDFNVLVTTT